MPAVTAPCNIRRELEEEMMKGMHPEIADALDVGLKDFLAWQKADLIAFDIKQQHGWSVEV